MEKNIEVLKDARVMVIGDIMLDRYIYGSVARISPEAPVPVVKAYGESETLGGAANVAHNIATLCAKCTLVGLAGNDPVRSNITGMLDVLNIRHHLLDAGLPTTAKIRLIGERQQIARVDYEELLPFGSPVLTEAYRIVEKYINDNDIIVISDYGKGMVSDIFSHSVIKLANANNKLTIVDPKGADWNKYTGASIITPNIKELSEAAGVKVRNEDGHVHEIGEEIRRKYDLRWLVVTRSEKGISVISEGSVFHMPTQAQEVFDVSGAGDTVVAALACALGGGVDIKAAVEIANRAAGIVVSKVGTVPVLYEDLLRSLFTEDSNGAITLESLLQITESARKSSIKVVFTNGCFDILHRGHVDYLHKAKQLGDILIVGLNSDESVKRLKGQSRPVNSQEDRSFVLSSLRDVDYVVIFNEDTPAELLSRIRPDILVKGGDYAPDEVIGREYAGEVSIIDFVNGYSTTSTIKKMKE